MASYFIWVFLGLNFVYFVCCGICFVLKEMYRIYRLDFLSGKFPLFLPYSPVGDSRSPGFSGSYPPPASWPIGQWGKIPPPNTTCCNHTEITSGCWWWRSEFGAKLYVLRWFLPQSFAPKPEQCLLHDVSMLQSTTPPPEIPSPPHVTIGPGNVNLGQK